MLTLLLALTLYPQPLFHAVKLREQQMYYYAVSSDVIGTPNPRVRLGLVLGAAAHQAAQHKIAKYSKLASTHMF